MSISLLQPKFNIVIIGGMAKSGTTLPLTLLDGHTDLLVFPEELRIYSMIRDSFSKKLTATKFLNNSSVRRLSMGTFTNLDGDYKSHNGVGFGKYDYSEFDYQIFEQNIRIGFDLAVTLNDYLNVITNSFFLSLKNVLLSPKYFVFKEPNCETIFHEYEKILGPRVKFLVTIRNSTEHFLTLKNINSNHKRFNVISAYLYCCKSLTRKKLWSRVNKNNIHILDYNLLVTLPKTTMKKLCLFLDIDWQDTLLRPTKMSSDWYGNSSRNKISNKIFASPPEAHLKLSRNIIGVIEKTLAGDYEQYGWKTITNSDNLQKATFIESLFVNFIVVFLTIKGKLGSTLIGNFYRMLLRK